MSYETCGIRTRPTASRNAFSEILCPLDFAQTSAFLLWSKLLEVLKTLSSGEREIVYATLPPSGGLQTLHKRPEHHKTPNNLRSWQGELLASKNSCRLTHPPTGSQLSVASSDVNNWCLQLFSQMLATNVCSQQQAVTGLHQHSAWLSDSWMSEDPAFCKSSDTSLLTWKLA